MATNDTRKIDTKSMSIFERYLTLWITLCITGGIVLGKLAPGFAATLDGMAIYVNKAPVLAIPIAICLRTQTWFKPHCYDRTKLKRIPKETVLKDKKSWLFPLYKIFLKKKRFFR